MSVQAANVGAVVPDTDTCRSVPALQAFSMDCVTLNEVSPSLDVPFGSGEPPVIVPLTQVAGGLLLPIAVDVEVYELVPLAPFQVMVPVEVCVSL